MYLCGRIARDAYNFTGKVGRVIDRAGLEIRYTPFGYRGFESLTFRQRSLTLRKTERKPLKRLPFFVAENQPFIILALVSASVSTLIRG